MNRIHAIAGAILVCVSVGACAVEVVDEPVGKTVQSVSFVYGEITQGLLDDVQGGSATHDATDGEYVLQGVDIPVGQGFCKVPPCLARGNDVANASFMPLDVFEAIRDLDYDSSTGRLVDSATSDEWEIAQGLCSNVPCLILQLH